MTEDTMIQANYETSPVLGYAGNPLIEALPPILSEEQAAGYLANIPPTPEDDRKLPKEIRLHLINRLTQLVQPLSIHLELEAAISSVIRSGYVGRNPMESRTWRHLHTLSKLKSSALIFNSTASIFSLVGLSGMGKTTALNAILRLYPQVIKHTNYKGREFVHTQIVWLKLECPFDGSLSGLCRTFFRALDNALNDNSHQKFYTSRRDIASLIQGMEQIASTYFVGALFIDELQHLRSAKTGGKENMLNFFVNLVNSIGIPVVFIGTNSMIGLFSDVVRNARRVSGLGLYDFKQPEEDDPHWDLMLNAIWNYQWVQQPVELSDGLRRQLYYYTQGVTDFLVKLMILGQRYAIQSGKERLDGTVFKHIATTKMKLLQPALAALRTNDTRRMHQFEDLLPSDVQLQELMTLDTAISDRIGILLRQQNATLGTYPNMSQPRPDANDKKSKVSIPSMCAKDDNDVEEDSRLCTQRSAFVSAKLTEHSDVMGLLKGEEWILEKPFEFVPAYRMP